MKIFYIIDVAARVKARENLSSLKTILAGVSMKNAVDAAANEREMKELDERLAAEEEEAKKAQARVNISKSKQILAGVHTRNVIELHSREREEIEEREVLNADVCCQCHLAKSACHARTDLPRPPLTLQRQAPRPACTVSAA